MINKKEIKFVRHFFGMFLLFIGILGTIIPLMPGVIFIGISLTLLQDIPFFKELKEKIDNKINSIVPNSIKNISRKYKQEKENLA